MRIKFYIAITLCSYFVSAQQQTLYTNITMHQFLYNPAFAGSNQGMQFNAGYRNQWTGFDGSPKVLMASGYGTFKKKPEMALGGLVISDKSGLLQRNSFYGAYSYHVKLGKKLKLGFGLAAGAVLYNVKIYNAKPYDKDDEFLRNNIINAGAFDANSGLYLYSKKYFFGFSSQQLVNSKIQWQKTKGNLTRHFYVYTGYTFTLDKKKKEWELQPSVLMRFNNPAPSQMEINLKTIYKQMAWLGGGYRFATSTLPGAAFGSSVYFLLGTTISEQYTIGYSYDYAATNLQKYSSGSHEIILSYTISQKKKQTVSDKVSGDDESEFNNINNSMKSNLKNKKKDEEKK